MADLIAQGEKPDERWQRALPKDTAVVLGGQGAEWPVSWERWISRRHAELTWKDGRLRVVRAPSARNPVFVRGREVDEFEIRPGEAFVVGRTVFTLAAEPTTDTSEDRPLVQVRTVSAQELRRIHYRDAPHRIDVLSRLTGVISSVADDTELFSQVVNLLLAGIRAADVIALVAADAGGGDDPPVRILHWDRRLLGLEDFRPSRRLVRDATLVRHDSVVHVWEAGGHPGDPSYTQQGNFDWAFCTPLRGEACKGWGLYVAGRLTGSAAAALLAPGESDDLGSDMKFAELVAAILSSLRQVRSLQHKQSILSHFFSPGVLRLLTEADPETALRPREAEVTVLFCDLRGFSRKVEEAAGDLQAVLERVSWALSVMSQQILDQGGVVADFQGDSAMGFWGWPFDQPDKVARACRAALGIRAGFEAFAKQPGHPLADFRVGIGVATGRAVAGQIGTVDQAQVTVFGPVVNLASRLEGLTKILRVPILTDEPTAEVVRDQVPRDVGRCRRLAVLRPYGLETPLTVSELLLPAAQDPVLSDVHVARYEAALSAFLEGQWATAYEQLHLIPPQDRGKDLLTEYILQHNHTPPQDWNRVIALTSKR